MTRSGGTTFIALLRGINVGRAKAVSMSDLREIVEAVGFADVRTILRSGNVVLNGYGTPAEVSRRLEAAIEAQLGLGVRVVVRTAAELAAILDANPIPEAATDGSRLHVMFLAAPLSNEEKAQLDAAEFGTDVVRPAGRQICIYYRHGMAGSDTATRFVRLIKTTATDRNWNTITKLCAIAGR